MNSYSSGAPDRLHFGILNEEEHRRKGREREEGKGDSADEKKEYKKIRRRRNEEMTRMEGLSRRGEEEGRVGL